MKFNSIKFKISVLYTAILFVLLILYSSILYFSLRNTLYDHLDAQLSEKVQEINNMIHTYFTLMEQGQADFFSAARRVIRFEGESQEDREDIINLDHQWLQRIDKLDLYLDYLNFYTIKDGSTISSYNPSKALLASFLKDIEKAKRGETTLGNIKVDNIPLRLISRPFYHKTQGQYILQIGTPVTSIISILKKRLFAVILTIPLLLLIAILVSFLFARRILRPVVEITQTAKNISHENLKDRVKSEHLDEEMVYLVDAFNDMIARMENAFHYLSEFSSHVAHELKTPLAIIRGEAEIVIRKKRDPEEYIRVIHITLEEIQRMLKCIDDIHLFSKLTYNPEIQSFDQFDLMVFLKEISEQMNIVASSKNIQVKCSLPEDRQAIIRGNKSYLRRLFFNLLDNAIKFTPEKGAIEIITESTDGGVQVAISDTGAGIAPDELEKIFQKFYRGYKNNSERIPGLGLGLNIAHTIAKIHNGSIEVKSELGKGTVFTTILPIYISS